METLRTKPNALELTREEIIKDGVFKHPSLDFVCLSGSTSANSSGPGSDIDITTVMKPEKAGVVDVEAIVNLADQIKVFSTRLVARTNMVPVVISTIRLEEAQIAMASMMFPDKEIVPLHWLHYPSVEFGKANEPPELFLGLLKGKVLQGEATEVVQRFDSASDEICSKLAGLDWLTDSFRVFLANSPLEIPEVCVGPHAQLAQPEGFLKKLATHNLEYFWRWKIIRPCIERFTDVKIESWKEASEHSSAVPPRLWETATRVRTLRHQGKDANTDEIVALHKATFEIWPRIIK
ncbi:MAG: hypothetical protein Q7S79_02965 [bacterium]|nr:hypothetical protein [bacterium]